MESYWNKVQSYKSSMSLNVKFQLCNFQVFSQTVSFKVEIEFERRPIQRQQEKQNEVKAEYINFFKDKF